MGWGDVSPSAVTLRLASGHCLAGTVRSSAVVDADPPSAGDAIPLPRVTNSIFGVPGVHLSQTACPILFQASLWSDVSPIFVVPSPTLYSQVVALGRCV